MTSTSISKHVIADEFGRLLNKAIQDEISKVMDDEIEQAKTRIEKAMRAAIGSIAARVLNNFSYERMGTDLLIRVQFAFPTMPDQPAGAQRI